MRTGGGDVGNDCASGCDAAKTCVDAPNMTQPSIVELMTDRRHLLPVWSGSNEMHEERVEIEHKAIGAIPWKSLLVTSLIISCISV